MVVTLFKVLHRPGGQEKGGEMNQRVSVSVMVDTNLQLVVYFIRHKRRVSRPYGYNDVILDNTRKLNCQRDM